MPDALRFPSNRHRRWRRRHDQKYGPQASGHRDAARAAAVRAIAALPDKRPAEIVAAIEAGRIPYVTLNEEESR